MAHILSSVDGQTGIQGRKTTETNTLPNQRKEHGMAVKKEAKQIDTIKSNVDSYFSPTASKDCENKWNGELE